MADVKVQYNGKQYTINVPKEIVNHMGIKKGDVIRFFIDRESPDVTIVRIKNNQAYRQIISGCVEDDRDEMAKIQGSVTESDTRESNKE